MTSSRPSRIASAIIAAAILSAIAAGCGQTEAQRAQQEIRESHRAVSDYRPFDLHTNRKVIAATRELCAADGVEGISSMMHVPPDQKRAARKLANHTVRRLVGSEGPITAPDARLLRDHIQSACERGMREG